MERRYPDGRFLTVVREPLARMQSAVNFMAVTPDTAMLGEPDRTARSSAAFELADLFASGDGRCGGAPVRGGVDGPDGASDAGKERAEPGVLARVGDPRWSWCVAGVGSTEIEHCALEMDWYQRAGARRCVVPFSDYVDHLEGTMRKVYRECLDQDALPPQVPRAHEPRQRTNYMVNRSLVQLGVDERELGQRLKGYSEWCRCSPS